MPTQLPRMPFAPVSKAVCAIAECPHDRLETSRPVRKTSCSAATGDGRVFLAVVQGLAW